MDLPTCPSCGQSVLDDDAQDCPFCGAAMDGSSKGKKPPAKQPSAAAEKKEAPAAKSEPDNDDPFAIAQSPAGQKVLPCSPKPRKGRLHRVVCPMCDTQGFIPKAAVGRQVRCANAKCLVPVFTAMDKEADGKAKAPARVSDEESPRPKKTAKGPSEKKPLVMYGIVGAVVLVLTLGLVAFLNKPGTDALPPPENLPDFTNIGDEGDPDVPANGSDKDPVPVAAIDHRGQATELVQEMVKTARIPTGHRDKPFCRRLTGDSFLRLGMDSEAQTEFAQMETISRNEKRDTRYFQIAPLIADYWQHLAANEAQKAAGRLDEARALLQEIPRTGLIAVESTIVLAAAMAQSGDVAGGLALIEGQQRDETVATQIDAIRHGVFSACSQSLRDAGQISLPPLEVFAWNEPLMTAVGLDLAAKKRWPSALAWAAALQQPLTKSDTLAVIASQMRDVEASDEVQQSVISAAQSVDAGTSLQVLSVLAQKKGSALWPKAKAAVTALPAVEQTPPSGVEAVINADSLDLAGMRLSSAQGLTEFAIAAIENGEDAAAVAAIQQIHATLSSQVLATAELRRLCGELETDKGEDRIKQQVARELSLPADSQQIRSKFLAYRRGVDRQASVAEERRLALLQLLARVIHGGGLQAVTAALAADDGALKQEVCVDELKGLLFVAAAERGQPFPEMRVNDPALEVPIARVDPVEETKVVTSLVEAWEGYLKSSTSASASRLETVNDLYGLRASMAAWMTELASLKAPTAAAQLVSIAALKDDRWREQCLPVATRVLTRRGMAEETQLALSDAARNPTQKVVALYGIVRGLVDLAAAE